MARKKEFDAVEMTRRIRDAHYEELKDKSREERIAYYREKSRKLREKLATDRREST